MKNRTNHLPGHAMHRMRRWFLGLTFAGAAAFAGTAAAASSLQNVTYDAQPGGRIELKLSFSGPVPEPKVFTTSNPPRIAVDLADTTNAFSTRHLDIGKGSTAGVSVIGAGGRTRVVIELFRESAYRTRVEGNDLFVTVNNGPTGATTTTAVVSDPTKALPSNTSGPAISNVDFRRGPNGEGRVLVTLGGAGVNPEMHREGDRVIVSLDRANVPAKIAQRLDVLDFATPVQSIDTKAVGGGARMEIRTKGEVEVSAYQSAEEYVVEVAPKKAPAKDPKAKGAEPTYSGNRVTFNFQDIPVRSALQLIADISGLNLVASDSVGGSVTLRLVNVPWDQALDVVLRAKGLDKRRSGNVVWIAPQGELASYEQSIADARQKAEDSAELVSDYVPISYGKAADIAKLLTSGSMQSTGGGGAAGNTARGFLSARGSVSFDERTNTLLINDNPEKIRELRDLIGVLDRPVQQVLIESRIVVATDTFSRDLGVKWGVQAFRQNPSGQVITTTPDLNAGSTGTTAGGASGLATNVHNAQVGTTSTITYPGGYNVNLPVTNPTGSLGLAILGANYLVDLELSAAQQEGKSEVISSPRVITANQQEAVIKQGQQIGYVTYQASSSGGGAQNATVQFKDAVLELRVTPTITADSRVYLKINVKKDALAAMIPAPGGGSVPQIDTREINTSVLVDNGQTVVLGGIYEITKTDTISKVPGLGDIPGIGVLFRNTSRESDKAELLIFVTPRILSETLQ